MCFVVECDSFARHWPWRAHVGVGFGRGFDEESSRGSFRAGCSGLDIMVLRSAVIQLVDSMSLRGELIPEHTLCVA